ncbi:MAG: DDE-type integrase/transposase/recombinase [Nanoarchaeota archaeon]
MKPKLKGRQHLDEKYVKVNGKDCYDLNCIDHITKYVTAHLFVEKRTFEKCVEFLRQIKITCYEQILERYRKEKYKPEKERKLITFVSDGFENYRNAFNKLFYNVARLQFGVPIKCKKYGLEHNNNWIERYNGKIKDRIKVMRGFGSFTCAGNFMDLRHIIHNFVNPHQGLKGKTPAEKADIKLPLGNNKLLDLIRYVKRRHITKR